MALCICHVLQALLEAANNPSQEAFDAACKRVSGLPVTAVHMTSGTTGSSKMFPYNDMAHVARWKGGFGVFGAAVQVRGDKRAVTDGHGTDISRTATHDSGSTVKGHGMQRLLVVQVQYVVCGLWHAPLG